MCLTRSGGVQATKNDKHAQPLINDAWEMGVPTQITQKKRMLNPIPVLADDFWGDSMIKWKTMFFFRPNYRTPRYAGIWWLAASETLGYISGFHPDHVPRFLDVPWNWSRFYCHGKIWPNSNQPWIWNLPKKMILFCGHRGNGKSSI